MGNFIQYDEQLELAPFVAKAQARHGACLPVLAPDWLIMQRAAAKEQGTRYRLHGVLVHSGGSLHSGHYYCYVRNTNNVWYQMDDASVGSTWARVG